MKSQKKHLKNKHLSWYIKLLSVILFFLFLLNISTANVQADIDLPLTTTSKDGSTISYEIYGEGKIPLIFVHGWCCDSRYWRMQVPFFSNKYKIVLVDLAGHGHSSAKRSNYTMESFGEDVAAVINAINCEKAILIGHSMGGPVIAQTAKIIPEKVIALVGIDTFENIEYPLDEKGKQEFLAPLDKDFPSGSRMMVNRMFSNSTSQRIREWVTADMSSAPPEVALSANHAYFDQYVTGEAATIFDEVRQPVYCVSGELWPINYEANRRHMSSFDAVTLKGAAHFLMLARPDEFNSALDKTIETILANNKLN
ncbi:alpha/beta fold hydrolase [Desulfovibrio sp. JC022]|uniref:alpha/beta fold hydrolase n=1 Tax=Desulfovibrio sp. JC022 TaxID=2593642 RepID=UPI00193ED03B|nr:alpha/beta hydrolase [Desulfovibrio sp. JC022]